MAATMRMPWANTMADLEETFRKWNVSQWEVRPRRERPGTQKETGVTVIYERGAKTITLNCKSQYWDYENLRVLYYAIEGLRMNEVRGLGEVMASAYLQIGAPKGKPGWEVLGIRSHATETEIKQAWIRLAREKHPDAGGTDAEMAALTKARDEMLAALNDKAPA